MLNGNEKIDSSYPASNGCWTALLSFSISNETGLLKSGRISNPIILKESCEMPVIRRESGAPSMSNVLCVFFAISEPDKTGEIGSNV